MKPIICPVAGKRCFSYSASQPLVRRHTPIFQNHRHRYGGSHVHEQTRTGHDRNAKQAVPRCINFLVSSTGSGSRSTSENPDFFSNCVPRHLEQKRKKHVLFSIGRSVSLQPIISCKEIQMNIQKLRRKLDTTEMAETPQTRQNKIVNTLLQMKWTLFATS